MSKVSADMEAGAQRSGHVRGGLGAVEVGEQRGFMIAGVAGASDCQGRNVRWRSRGVVWPSASKKQRVRCSGSGSGYKLKIAWLGRQVGRFTGSSVCLGLVFFFGARDQQCIAGSLRRWSGENVYVCTYYVCTW